MKVIGVTGKSGSGKSYFSKQLNKKLAEKNIDSEYINCDSIFFDVLNTDEQVKKQIIEQFGDDAYDSAEHINVQEIQKSGDDAFSEIFKYVYNPMNEIISNKVKEAESDNKDILILDWFVLPKLEVFKNLDYSVLVEPTEEARNESLMSRNEEDTPEKIKKRDNAILINFEDYEFDKVIKNDYKQQTIDFEIEETIENLERKVDMHKEIKRIIEDAKKITIVNAVTTSIKKGIAGDEVAQSDRIKAEKQQVDKSIEG